MLTIFNLRIILQERCFTKEVLLQFSGFLIIAIFFFVSCNSQNHDSQDSPDEYDPQCVKSLWKDVNKEVYEMYINEEFKVNNEYVGECYPWPCEWDVTYGPRQLHSCDIDLSPRAWGNTFRPMRRISNMFEGNIVMEFSENLSSFSSASPSSM
jgi:hypothetical protein